MNIPFDKDKLIACAKQFSLRFVIVHGSNVTGNLHKESDFDLAVLGFQDIDFRDLLKLHAEFSEIFQLPAEMDLDIKSLHKVDPLFRYEVTSSSELLYGDAADYEEYKASAFHAYEDARPLFELERQLVYKFQQHLNNLHA